MSSPLTQPKNTQSSTPPPIVDSNQPLNFKYIYTSAYMHLQATLDDLYPDVDMDMRLRQITHICTSSADEAQRFVDASGSEDRREWLVLLGYMLSWFEAHRIGGKLATRRLRVCAEVLEHHPRGGPEGRVQLAECYDVEPVERVGEGAGEEEASGGARDGEGGA
jgi:hypothetical protein